MIAHKYYKNYTANHRTDFGNKFHPSYSVINKSAIKCFFGKHPEIQSEVLSDAVEICKNTFSFLGKKHLYVGDEIPWTSDTNSGRTWPDNDYKKIDYMTSVDGSDVKWVWELSRFYQAFTLSKAYVITGNPIFLSEYKNQIKSWIKNNSYRKTVNWTCSMEVAIRSVNWLCGYSLVKEEVQRDKEFMEIFNESLLLHAIHIYTNLEKGYEYSNNHYLADLAGLAFLGLYFKNSKPLSNLASKWIDYAIKELNKEVLKQIHLDGSSYECSTYYSKQILEILLHTTLMLRNNGYSLDERALMRIKHLSFFIRSSVKPNGLSPLIGDCDDGRFLVLSNYSNFDPRNFLEVLALSSELFGEDLLREYRSRAIEASFWISGEESKSYKEATFEKKDVHSFSSGFHFFRNGNVYLAARSGPMSYHGRGGHSHNDQLSFELSIFGNDIIVDPGTYVYTGSEDMRNLFRGSSMHNSPFLENQEQNMIYKGKVFELPEMTHSCFEYYDKSNLIKCCHRGYYSRFGIIVCREIQVESHSIHVRDYLRGSERKLQWNVNLVFSPDTTLRKIADNHFSFEIAEVYGEIVGKNYLMSLGTTKVSFSYGTLLDTCSLLMLCERHEASFTIVYNIKS